MHSSFEEMTPQWFMRAHFYTGSISDRERGTDFRFRYEQSENGKALKASTYSRVAYELADDVEEELFPWTEEGVEALRAWYQSQYEKYLAQHA